jgi:peptidoglycan/xylan/chitin deacetylase (PgdA/CDA1 family)
MANALCDVMGAVGDSAQLAFSLPLRRPRTVFIFHSISAISRPDSSETHRPEVFERFLRWLAQRSVVGEARAIVDPVLPAHGQAVAWLSFDDGFLDHYTTVFRLLLEHKMTATFFIPTSVVDSPGMITRPMMREMSDRGMTIGSHSVSHCRLSDCQPLEIWRELTESRAYLEDLTGRPCDQLAYPFGYHNELARNMARRAGYRSPTPCARPATWRLSTMPGDGGVTCGATNGSTGLYTALWVIIPSAWNGPARCDEASGKKNYIADSEYR